MHDFQANFQSGPFCHRYRGPRKRGRQTLESGVRMGSKKGVFYSILAQNRVKKPPFETRPLFGPGPNNSLGGGGCTVHPLGVYWDHLNGVYGTTSRGPVFGCSPNKHGFCTVFLAKITGFHRNQPKSRVFTEISQNHGFSAEFTGFQLNLRVFS